MAGHVARIGKERNAYRTLAGKTKSRKTVVSLNTI